MERHSGNLVLERLLEAVEVGAMPRQEEALRQMVRAEPGGNPVESGVGEEAAAVAADRLGDLLHPLPGPPQTVGLGRRELGCVLAVQQVVALQSRKVGPIPFVGCHGNLLSKTAGNVALRS